MRVGDLLVVRQGGGVEGLGAARAHGEGVGLLLGGKCSSVRLVHVQTERTREAVGHHKGKVLDTFQLTGQFMTDLQSYGVVTLLQLQRVLQGTRISLLSPRSNLLSSQQ